jgi:hypothetical protein
MDGRGMGSAGNEGAPGEPAISQRLHKPKVTRTIEVPVAGAWYMKTRRVRHDLAWRDPSRRDKVGTS